MTSLDGRLESVKNASVPEYDGVSEDEEPRSISPDLRPHVSLACLVGVKWNKHGF